MISGSAAHMTVWIPASFSQTTPDWPWGFSIKCFSFFILIVQIDCTDTAWFITVIRHNSIQQWCNSIHCLSGVIRFRTNTIRFRPDPIWFCSALIQFDSVPIRHDSHQQRIKFDSLLIRYYYLASVHFDLLLIQYDSVQWVRMFPSFDSSTISKHSFVQKKCHSVTKLSFRIIFYLSWASFKQVCQLFTTTDTMCIRNDPRKCMTNQNRVFTIVATLWTLRIMNIHE